MLKSELTAILANRFPQLLRADIDVSVAAILEALATTICRGDRVEIRGFGSFGLNYRPPRSARNPKTGAKVQVPATWTPHFKPGKRLRERVGSLSPAARLKLDPIPQSPARP